MKILQEITAVKLLQLKAIKFQPNNPFVWANGWNAPVYCDDRKILSYPKYATLFVSNYHVSSPKCTLMLTS